MSIWTSEDTPSEWTLQEATSSKNLTLLDDWQHNNTLTLWGDHRARHTDKQTERKEENRRRQGSESVLKRRRKKIVTEEAQALCTHETLVHRTRENKNDMSSQQLAWTICTHLCLMQLSALEEDRKLTDSMIQRSIKCREQALSITFKPEGQTRTMCKSQFSMVLFVWRYTGENRGEMSNCF